MPNIYRRIYSSGTLRTPFRNALTEKISDREENILRCLGYDMKEDHIETMKLPIPAH